MSEIIQPIALGLMFIGLFFVFVAAVGIVRFPDIYTRLHAATKGVTFGFAFLIMGAAMLLQKGPDDIAKAVLAIIFQLLVAPIAGHMIARVAVRKGIRPVKNPQGELYDAQIALTPDDQSDN